jgi:hypothetical protein
MATIEKRKLQKLPIGTGATGKRVESDSMGEIEVPAEHYWGAQTQRSLIHFSIGDEHMPKAVYHAYGYVKKAAALVKRAHLLWTSLTPYTNWGPHRACGFDPQMWTMWGFRHELAQGSPSPACVTPRQAAGTVPITLRTLGRPLLRRPPSVHQRPRVEIPARSMRRGA